MNWGDNYPAVNQNGLSDRNLPQVKVKRVLKITDRAPPLPVNNLRHKTALCSNDFFSLLKGLTQLSIRFELR